MHWNVRNAVRAPVEGDVACDVCVEVHGDAGNTELGSQIGNKRCCGFATLAQPQRAFVRVACSRRWEVPPTASCANHQPLTIAHQIVVEKDLDVANGHAEQRTARI